MAEHAHHIKPKGRGGDDSPANCAPLCHRCHRFVHDNPKIGEAVGLILPMKHWTDENVAERRCWAAYWADLDHPRVKRGDLKLVRLGVSKFVVGIVDVLGPCGRIESVMVSADETFEVPRDNNSGFFPLSKQTLFDVPAGCGVYDNFDAADEAVTEIIIDHKTRYTVGPA
ncbi:MAG: HNH endonuclease [Tepidisphaeraceae bacterium]